MQKNQLGDFVAFFFTEGVLTSGIFREIDGTATSIKKSITCTKGVNECQKGVNECVNRMGGLIGRVNRVCYKDALIKVS